MNREGYNGWTNYETWAVALWLDNEEGSYHHKAELADTAWEDAEGSSTRKEDAEITLGHALKVWLEESMPDLGGTLWSDLLSAAMSEVNWHEIAVAALEEYEEEVEEEAETEANP